MTFRRGVLGPATVTLLRMLAAASVFQVTIEASPLVQAGPEPSDLALFLVGSLATAALLIGRYVIRRGDRGGPGVSRDGVSGPR